MARGDVMTSKGTIINMDALIDHSNKPIDNKSTVDGPTYKPATGNTPTEMRGFVPSTDDVRQIVNEPENTTVSIADITKVKVQTKKKQEKPTAKKAVEQDETIGDLINELDKSGK